MNLLIPIGASSKFFNPEDYSFPNPLIEILGKPMIEYVVNNLTLDVKFNKIIFVVKEEDCSKFHLDRTLKLLCPIEPEVIKLQKETQGALCTVLLAIDHINNTEPLIIANADQIFDGGIAQYINKFRLEGFDAGCVIFNSVHPRWSYVRTNKEGDVIEVVEKKPISKNAIAGLYLYKSGEEFIKFGIMSLKRNLSTSEYYISPVFNEYILYGKKISTYSIENSAYHSFYSPQKIHEYESILKMAAS
jgi:dTDP-glucose pyrophosphorylase